MRRTRKVFLFFALFCLTVLSFPFNFREDIRLVFWKVWTEPAYEQEGWLLLAKVTAKLGNDYGVTILDRNYLEKILGEDTLRGIITEDLRKYQNLLDAVYALDIQFVGRSSDLILRLINLITGATEMTRSLKYRGQQDDTFLYQTLESIYNYLRLPVNPSDNVRLSISVQPRELFAGERLYISVISNAPFTYIFYSDLDGNIKLIYETTQPTITISGLAILPDGVDESKEYIVVVSLLVRSLRMSRIKHIDELVNLLKKEYTPAEWQIGFRKYVIVRGEGK